MPALTPDEVEAVRAILESSFPPDERADLDELVADDGRRFFLARDGGSVVGFATTLRLDGADGHVLEYLAVADGHRDAGVGGELLDTLVGELRGSAAGLVLEADHPDDASGDERARRVRRLGFYERHAARVVECAPDYRAPRIGFEGTLRYVLMWIPFDEGGPPTGDALRSLVSALLVESYGLAAGDALVGDAVAGLTC